jgi:hypothetical protein
MLTDCSPIGPKCANCIQSHDFRLPLSERQVDEAVKQGERFLWANQVRSLETRGQCQAGAAFWQLGVYTTLKSKLTSSVVEGYISILMSLYISMDMC